MAECSTGHVLLGQVAYSQLLPAKLQHKGLQIFGNFQLVALPHVGGVLQVVQEAVLCSPDEAKCQFPGSASRGGRNCQLFFSHVEAPELVLLRF